MFKLVILNQQLFLNKGRLLQTLKKCTCLVRLHVWLKKSIGSDLVLIVNLISKNLRIMKESCVFDWKGENKCPVTNLSKNSDSFKIGEIK